MITWQNFLPSSRYPSWDYHWQSEVRAATTFSQLETLTLALSVCGVCTHVACWYKPQNINVPFTVRLRDRIETRLMRDVLGGYSDKTYDNFWNIINNHGWHSKKGRSRVGNDNMPHSSPSIAHLATPVLAILPTAFGCIHLIAWNYGCPAEIEQLAWRIAVSTSAATPLIGLLAIPLAQIIVQFGDPCAFVYDCRHVLQELSWVAALMTNSIPEDDNPAGKDFD